MQFTPGQARRMIKEQGCVQIIDVPQPIFHRRPTGYNDAEWLSYIYFMEYGYSSIVKDRKAPQDFLDRFLERFKQHVANRNSIDDSFYQELRRHVRREYAKQNPNDVLTLHRIATGQV